MAALVFCLAASYFDLKTREIPDKLIIIGIITSIFVVIFTQNYFGLLIGPLVFVVGALFNKKGLIGGGDVKVFAVLGTLLPLKILFIASASMFLALAYTILVYSYNYALKTSDNEPLKAFKFVPFITIALILCFLF